MESNTTSTPSLFELDARFRALVNQRNAALDECVLLAGENAVLRAQVSALQVPPVAEPVATPVATPAAQVAADPVPAAPAESPVAE